MKRYRVAVAIVAVILSALFPMAVKSPDARSLGYQKDLLRVPARSAPCLCGDCFCGDRTDF